MLTFYLNIKIVFSYKAHYYMCPYAVWIEINAQTGHGGHLGFMQFKNSLKVLSVKDRELVVRGLW